MSLSDADALEQLRLERDDIQAKLRTIAHSETSDNVAGAKPNKSGSPAIDHQGFYALLSRRLDSLNAQILELTEKMSEQEAYNVMSRGCV